MELNVTNENFAELKNSDLPLVVDFWATWCKPCVRELNAIDLKPLYCEGKAYTGKYLMDHGLEMPYTNEVEWGKKTDWSSRVIYLEAE